MLREEGGLEYKASIADTIIAIIEENPEAKETGWLYLNCVFYGCVPRLILIIIYNLLGLAHLCEFIEDCEHTSLTVRIIHLLGKEGPRTKQPSR